jgi:hypothetical protein
LKVELPSERFIRAGIPMNIGRKTACPEGYREPTKEAVDCGSLTTFSTIPIKKKTF